MSENLNLKVKSIFEIFNDITITNVILNQLLRQLKLKKITDKSYRIDKIFDNNSKNN
ncbi:hypothetical protein [Defluviitalea phaphyphila]|uniref:hypothetical protein n=1 Tax=Defluviitalea phaphyphila TaxID=1473580 RepID=UPI001A9A33E6|nr:hypothetical protein [Defluviitalea phaphyphila]